MILHVLLLWKFHIYARLWYLYIIVKHFFKKYTYDDSVFKNTIFIFLLFI